MSPKSRRPSPTTPRLYQSESGRLLSLQPFRYARLRLRRALNLVLGPGLGHGTLNLLRNFGNHLARATRGRITGFDRSLHYRSDDAIHKSRDQAGREHDARAYYHARQQLGFDQIADVN